MNCLICDNVTFKENIIIYGDCFCCRKCHIIKDFSFHCNYYEKDGRIKYMQFSDGGEKFISIISDNFLKEYLDLIAQDKDAKNDFEIIFYNISSKENQSNILNNNASLLKHRIVLKPFFIKYYILSSIIDVLHLGVKIFKDYDNFK